MCPRLPYGPASELIIITVVDVVSSVLIRSLDLDVIWSSFEDFYVIWLLNMYIKFAVVKKSSAECGRCWLFAPKKIPSVFGLVTAPARCMDAKI
jgi:hypothetical protein